MFRGTIIRNEPAFRPRPAELPGYHKFSQGQYDAFVAVSALDHIAHEAQRAAPDETIGYLVGRPFRDDKGNYAIVSDAITATSARRGRTTVETTLDDERQLLDTLRGNHPTAEKLGWFHSHPFPLPSYSGTDAENQQFWSESYHLGLLATLESESDAVRIHAFRGPGSERLQPAYTTDGRPSKGFSIPPRRFRPLWRPAAGGDVAPGFRHTWKSPYRWFSQVTTMIVVGIIWPIVYLVGVWMIVQAMRENAIQAAGESRALRPVAKSEQVEPQDEKEFGHSKAKTATPSGQGEASDAKSQNVGVQPLGEKHHSGISEMTAQSAKAHAQHEVPKVDAGGGTAASPAAAAAQASADAKLNQSKR